MTMLFAFVPQALVRVAVRPHIFTVAFVIAILPFALIPAVIWRAVQGENNLAKKFLDDASFSHFAQSM